MINKLVLPVALAAIGALSSAALARDDTSFSKDGRLAFAAPHGSTAFMPNYARKQASATIFSNLATAYPKGLYFSGEGSTLLSTQFVAGGFTPKANAVAVSVQVAVGNFGDGRDAFTVSIYSDKAGVPGRALASVVVTATTAFGNCCGLIDAKFKTGVSLKGSTPYWVAVTLNKQQITANDDGAWNFSTTDQVDAVPFSYNLNGGAGWIKSSTTLPPAFGVFSK